MSEILKLTSSEYGFIGEVLHRPDGRPYLKTYAITNIAWTDKLRAFYREKAPKGLEFENLETLSGAVIKTGKPVIANHPARDRRRGGLPEGHPPLRSFLGLPILSGSLLSGVLGLANRPGGYDKKLVTFLKPILITSARIVDALRNERRRIDAENALRSSLQEKEVLLKEIHHRVKNNLQVVSSLINLQIHKVEDPAIQEMFLESQHRIRSMALVHDKLYRSKDLARIDFAGYIQSLVAHLVHSLQVDPSRVKLALDVQDVALDINTAVPLGLIINELVSNALKHAFPWNRAGTVRVFLRPAEDNRYRLIVSDDGIGFPAGLDIQRTETLGLQIVSMLVEQLDGTISLSRDKGTIFSIEFTEVKYKPRL